MIHELHIQGFKSLSNADIKLSPMTILSGINGSGKSSVIQSIRMLIDSKKQSSIIKALGGYDEIHSKYSQPGQDINLNVTIKEHIYSLEINKDGISYNKSPDVTYEYINAERFGPQVNLPINTTDDITIGSRGEYSADYYISFQSCIVHDSLKHDATVSLTLEGQLKAWMQEISPNMNLKFNIDKKHDTSNIEINSHRATNTGFGISYALPIILSSLVLTSKTARDLESKILATWYERLSSNSKLILIENPEAHLHPQGQTMMGVFLTRAAACGLQVVVETHSDHFIDGVRIAAKEIGFHNSVNIYHFDKQQDTESNFENIKVLENGALTSWPKGFFDQSRINLSRINKRK
ncbi:AAA family ATPase [Aeromonas caviae]|uniref:AAA family ATPase n=1 Tax=Aeromonas caviae TaxID=648 RepID=UPI002B47592F|nr:DUF3696 domain-containing protein [Aeromonas caviae]